MASLEAVDKLRERANVTFDEAREALDMSNGDMLEAMIYLEKQGKVPPPRRGAYSTGEEAGDRFGDGGRNDYFFDSEMNDGRAKKKRDRAGQTSKSGGHGRGRAYYYDERDRRSGAASFFSALGRILAKAFRVGNNTLFEVTRQGKDVIKAPLTVLVAAAIFVFPYTAILLLVGLFLGCRYRLVGREFDGDPINSAMDSASRVADTIKDTINKNIK